MPVSLVGAHVAGKPNFLAVAWFTMASYKPPRIAISLGKGHYTCQVANAWNIGKIYKAKRK
jgi:flavin reductase (DIM6/NTAB) family NADH-FMN oxidoreductase RutF